MGCSYCCSGDEPELLFFTTQKKRNEFRLFACERLMILKAHDLISYEHSIITSKLALVMANALELFKRQKSLLYWNSLLHDIGKVAVPKYILRKPARLTKEEYDLVLKHTKIGYDYIANTFQMDEYFLPILYHHTPYNHLIKLKISLETIKITSILSVIDAIEAITSPRPYDPIVRSVDEAVEIIKNDEGKYDMKLVNIAQSVSKELSKAILMTRNKFGKNH